MLSPEEVAATAATIAAAQRPDGLVPRSPGGAADPWNHVEAAMALTAGGRRADAERAYRWLATTQHVDGSWCAGYHAGRITDATRDTNQSSYVAVGVWHHYLATGDAGFLEAMFPVVDAAVGFAVRHQRPGGEVRWAVAPDGRPDDMALLTASSSVYLSLRCAVATAEHLGRPRPGWEAAARRLGAAVAHRPDAFDARDRWAMDWYYPVLCGAVRGSAARRRLLGRWDEFVLDGRGVRCVGDRPWVTAAETAECALACGACGMDAEAVALLEWARALRHHDGSYWTGYVHPDGVHFPAGERTTYSAAAVVLAAAALTGDGRAAALFRGPSLPPALVRSAPVADPAQHP
ncbi:MAG: prenyltransferase [Actinomycetota bacterium]|nr:prenyltransferase [Actinomycetota bacterium]